MNRGLKWMGLLALALVYGGMMWRVLGADPVPNTFVNGEVADADKVNANFQTLTQQLTALESQIPALTSGVTALQPASTVVVHPTLGNAAASGPALLAAMATITGPSSTRPFALVLEPGIYDLGSSSLTMKSYVDLVGSGFNTTVIKSTSASGTIVGAEASEIRNVTIQSDGGTAIAFTNVSFSLPNFAYLRGVSIYATGTTVTGVSMNNSIVMIRDADIYVAGSVDQTGVSATGTGFLGMIAVNFPDPDSNNIGTAISLSGGIGATLNTVESHGHYATALSITGNGTSVRANGLHMESGTVGLSVTDNSDVHVQASFLQGDTDAILVATGGAADVATSLVNGSVSVTGGGTLTCVFDHNFDSLALDANCQ